MIIPVISNFKLEYPDKCYKYVSDVQIVLNSSFQRTIGMTPFKLTFGVEMRMSKYLCVFTQKINKKEYARALVDMLKEN